MVEQKNQNRTWYLNLSRNNLELNKIILDNFSNLWSATESTKPCISVSEAWRCDLTMNGCVSIVSWSVLGQPMQFALHKLVGSH